MTESPPAWPNNSPPNNNLTVRNPPRLLRTTNHWLLVNHSLHHQSLLIAKINYLRWNRRQPKTWRKTSWWRRLRRVRQMMLQPTAQLPKSLNLKKHRTSSKIKRCNKKINRIRKQVRRSSRGRLPLAMPMRMHHRISHSNSLPRHKCKHWHNHRKNNRPKNNHKQYSKLLSHKKLLSNQQLLRNSNSSHRNSKNKYSNLRRLLLRQVHKLSSSKLRWSWWKHWIQRVKNSHQLKRNRLKKWFNNY